MGFLKSLLGLGGDDATPKNDDNKSKEFDVLKYDGVRALRMGQNDYAVKCFEHALQIHDDLETCDYLSLAFLRLGDLESSYQYLSVVSPKPSPITSRYGCVWPMWPICVKTTTPSNR